MGTLIRGLSLPLGLYLLIRIGYILFTGVTMTGQPGKEIGTLLITLLLVIACNWFFARKKRASND